ncbi:uncharacterized protein [Magallana gigas]|uniref:uncharacterized protein isoform X2 n=1 Tax=Magallana gigas TaxID=29159 RepID=UPI00333EFE3D
MLTPPMDLILPPMKWVSVLAQELDDHFPRMEKTRCTTALKWYPIGQRIKERGEKVQNRAKSRASNLFNDGNAKASLPFEPESICSATRRR